jgi:hypothetical protein
VVLVASPVIPGLQVILVTLALLATVVIMVSLVIPGIAEYLATVAYPAIQDAVVCPAIQVCRGTQVSVVDRDIQE